MKKRPSHLQQPAKRTGHQLLAWLLVCAMLLPVWGTAFVYAADLEEGVLEDANLEGDTAPAEGEDAPQQEDGTPPDTEQPGDSDGTPPNKEQPGDGTEVPALRAGMIMSWTWPDEDGPEWYDDAGCFGLGVPNMDEPLTADLLRALLPEAIIAALDDGQSVTLPLTWDLTIIPAEGIQEGRYTLNAILPEGYVLSDDAPALTVLLETGGGEVYAPTKKYVNNWEYVHYGNEKVSEKDYSYFVDIYIRIPPEKTELIKRLEGCLPRQISGIGYYSQVLIDAGFILPEGSPTLGEVEGYVNIKWNIEEVLSKNPGFSYGGTYTFDAKPVSNPGYELCINSKNKDLPENANDTSEIGGILNLTVTVHELPLEKHTVASVNPANTTVNLFDYWVGTDGASGDDLLPKSDIHVNSNNVDVKRTGVNDWNSGINKGHILLFGDGIIHAGFWNKGAGAITPFGKANAGMMGIVKPILGEDGYPVINTDAMNDNVRGYTEDSPEAQVDNAYKGIIDWELCGDHNDTAGTGHTSDDPKNVSKTAQDAWDKDPSLQYLFNLEEGNGKYKRAYSDVKGLFQLDNYGYYYYNMRQNYAEYDEKENKFILYDAPAVDRTDSAYRNGVEVTDERSIGNFFPFNPASEVFDGVKDGKLTSSEAVQSHNGRNKSVRPMNHHLGMTVEIAFRQPVDGKITTGVSGQVPMTFQFSGDDDVWVFIDDVLVLDLGGTHSEIFGTIDFSTGEVLIGQTWKNNGFPYNENGVVDMQALRNYIVGKPTTLKELFEAALSEEEFKKINWKGNTFASDTNHTLKMFYLERGNYDSSLALRFNLQPQLFQTIKKVDQEGKPIAGVGFELYPAVKATKGETGAIECLYTDANVEGNKTFYIKQQDGAQALATLTTDAHGMAVFKNGDEPFGFADQKTNSFFILKETTTPAGYRSQPVDIVLHYDSATAMLTVANRWTTGAYACSVSNVQGTGRLTYGAFDPDTGNIKPDSTKQVDSEWQEAGLAVAVPMLRQKESGDWQALYGSNISGFKVVEVKAVDGKADAAQDVVIWRKAVLTAALEQIKAGDDVPHWYFDWDKENRRLTGDFSDLPGLASRYQIIDPDGGDMRMVYGMIEGKALMEALQINEATPKARYEALRAYLATHTVEETVAKIMDVEVGHTASGKGFSFLNTSQFNRNFRSLIYIPNEQRELWVMKVDQKGVPKNDAEFALYSDKDCQTEVARGKTATVNGQAGLLIFKPQPPKDGQTVRLGYAEMVWANGSGNNYYLKETKAPDGLNLNDTVIPVVVGTYAIYADAGNANDGVSVMAGVGRLTQTMRQYAGDNKVDITLRDITAYGQYQEAGKTNVPPADWKDMKLQTTLANAVLRSMDLHYKLNATVDYGLHDKDGGKIYKPFFVTDTGFIRARVEQNYPALVGTGDYEGEASDTDVNKDQLSGVVGRENVNLTNLFSLLNVVVVTDRAPEGQEPDAGQLAISKMVEDSTDPADYTRNFTFKIELTEADGTPLGGSYYFWGQDKTGEIKNGDVFVLHNDEKITIQGLPTGTKFKVTESKENGWYVTPASGIVEGDIKKGETAEAKFTNSKDPNTPVEPKTGELTISKTVTGQGNKEKDFTFMIVLSKDGAALTGEFSYDGSKTGKISSGGTITLKHGQSVTIHGLPEGTKYTVTESGSEGYTVTPSSGIVTGTITAGGKATAAFTNHIPDDDGPDDPPKDPPKDPEEPPKDPPKDPEEPPKDPPKDPEEPPEDPPKEPWDPEHPDLPDPNDPDSPDEITIEEDGVPKTYKKVWDPVDEEWEWILDEEVPLAPMTGDSGCALLWTALFAASGAGLALLGRKKKKAE